MRTYRNACGLTKILFDDETYFQVNSIDSKFRLILYFFVWNAPKYRSSISYRLIPVAPSASPGCYCSRVFPLGCSGHFGIVEIADRNIYGENILNTASLPSFLPGNTKVSGTVSAFAVSASHSCKKILHMKVPGPVKQCRNGCGKIQTNKKSDHKIYRWTGSAQFRSCVNRPARVRNAKRVVWTWFSCRCPL